MAKLTNADKKLLQHPPTEETWRCKAKRVNNEGEFVCRTPNSGLAHSCWLCQEPKPLRPQRIWPEYLTACNKAGIEPGMRWREYDTPPAAPRSRARIRRKGNA